MVENAVTTYNPHTSLTAPHGHDFNSLQNTRGSTALHLAAHKGHMKTVRLLLEVGSDIDTTNGEGMSALHVAIQQKNSAIIQCLLEHGASSSLTNNTGQNALHLAVETDSVPLVELVLNYVTELNSRDRNGKSAFHYAVERGNEQMVRSMLLKGVNSKAKVGEETPAGDQPSFNWAMVNQIFSDGGACG